jgi:hypothetical protein
MSVLIQQDNYCVLGDGMPNDALNEEARLEGERAESESSYRQVLADRDSELGELFQTCGPGSATWQTAKTQLISADEKCRAIFAKLHRLSDRMSIAPIIVVIVALGLAGLEMPINKFMLDNILQGNNAESYLFSFFMTLILLLLAHIAGKLTRQIWGAYKETIYISNIVAASVIVVLLLFCVGALTIGRAAYSATSTNTMLPGNLIFSEIGRQIRNSGLWGAFLHALSDQNAFFLACMNMAGIAASFFAAFITNDSDKVYQAALDERESTHGQLVGAERKYARLVEKVARKYRPDLAGIAATYASQTARIIALKRGRNCPLDADDRKVLSDLDQLLDAVRNHIETELRRSESHEPTPRSAEQARQPTRVSLFPDGTQIMPQHKK